MRVFGWCVVCKRPRLVDVKTSDLKNLKAEIVKGVCNKCEEASN